MSNKTKKHFRNYLTHSESTFQGKGYSEMNNQSFDVQRIAEGYAKRPWLHKEVINQIKKDCNIESFENGLDVGCGAGLSSKALKLICNHVTGTDISSEMISVCQRIYKDDAYHFYVCKAEESRIPKIPYDIITAAGVINWVERKPFLQNADKVLKEHGLIVIYDFWITDQMLQSEKYTDWYRKQYLQRFPKPPRKENVWTQSDLPETFIMEKQITYQMEYEFLT